MRGRSCFKALNDTSYGYKLITWQLKNEINTIEMVKAIINTLNYSDNHVMEINCIYKVILDEYGYNKTDETFNEFR